MRPVCSVRASALPVPNALFCAIDADRMIFSALETPAPKVTLPVGRSFTFMLMSTWSLVPGTDGLSTVTSEK